jgi:hypothetical protein
VDVPSSHQGIEQMFEEQRQTSGDFKDLEPSAELDDTALAV